jgi:hypothetical protein
MLSIIYELVQFMSYYKIRKITNVPDLNVFMI